MVFVYLYLRNLIRRDQIDKAHNIIVEVRVHVRPFLYHHKLTPISQEAQSALLTQFESSIFLIQTHQVTNILPKNNLHYLMKRGMRQAHGLASTMKSYANIDDDDRKETDGRLHNTKDKA